MTLFLQPPDQSKEKTSSTQTGEAKPTPTKEAALQSGKDSVPAKDVAPPVQQPAPEIPVQLPPGAQIAVPPKEQPKNFQIGSILEPALLLIGILTVGAILIAWLKKNRDQQTRTAALSANDQLTAFRESLEQGDMTDEEFKKVKAHLAEKIRKPANPVTAASGQAPQTGQVPPANDAAK